MLTSAKGHEKRRLLGCRRSAEAMSTVSKQSVASVACLTVRLENPL